MFYQNNGVNHEIRRCITQKIVIPEKKCRALNDGCVLGFEYNLYAQELKGGGSRRCTPGETDGETEWSCDVLSKFGKNQLKENWQVC